LDCVQIITQKRNGKSVIKSTKVALSTLLLLAVSGCSTPRERCIAIVSKNYKEVQEKMETTQQNIERGYAIHKERVPHIVRDICYKKNPTTQQPEPYVCSSTEFRTQSTPVAIDIGNEKDKLAEYKRLLSKYRAQMDAGIRQCEAQFPS